MLGRKAATKVQRTARDGSKGCNTLVGNVRRAAKSIILSLDFLLGALSLLLSLILDEIHLGFVCFLLTLSLMQLLLHLGEVGFLRQHIDDGLLFVSILGVFQSSAGQFEVMCWCLDEHDAIVLANWYIIQWLAD